MGTDTEKQEKRNSSETQRERQMKLNETQTKKTEINGSSSNSSGEIRNQDTGGTGRRSKCQKTGKGDNSMKCRKKEVQALL